MNPELQAFMNAVVVPALLDRFLSEHAAPRCSLRTADAWDEPAELLLEAGEAGRWVN
jgi:hypothetical protein